MISSAAYSAARSHTQTLADPVLAFQARCEALAVLYHAGEMTLHETVDGLQQAAEQNGLIRRIGQDAVQAIMSSAFRVVRTLEG